MARSGVARYVSDGLGMVRQAWPCAFWFVDVCLGGLWHGRQGKRQKGGRVMAAFRPKLYRYEGYQFPVPAQVVGELCEKIEERDGEVTRKGLLDASRDEASPTHKLFEWDDDVAAEKWRMYQAGKVLQALKITIITPDREKQTQRAYVNVIPKDVEGSYRSFNIAMTQVDLREGVLQRALRELTTFQEKYSNLTELSKVFDAIKIVTKEYDERETKKHKREKR